MALKNCRECGTEVSDQAKTCPRCGIKNPVKRTSLVTKILLGIVAVPFIVILVGKLAGPDKSGTNATTPTATTQNAASAQPTEQKPVSSWRYAADPDSMGKGTIHFAGNESTNTLSFKFPYTGEQHATLSLRKHPRQGSDVLIAIERGQFVCGIDRCNVLVRFDDGDSMRFNAVGPSDHSSTALFITPFDKFYTRMLKAKRVRIEADFYQEGTRMMDFDVSGFDASKL